MSKELVRQDNYDQVDPRFPYPNIYGENLRVSEYSQLPDEELERRQKDYWVIAQNNLMPRARAEVGRVLMHLGFEIDWRKGDKNA